MGKEQQDDPTLTRVREWIVDKASPTRLELRGEAEDLHQYANMLPQLSVDDSGLLMRSTKLEEWEAASRKQLLVPSSLKDAVFKWSHEHRTAGHSGAAATLFRVQQRFFWRGMHRELQQKVAKCVKCIEKIRSILSKGTQHVPGLSGYVGEKFNVDIVGPLPITV